jgi:hypothetical protein
MAESATTQTKLCKLCGKPMPAGKLYNKADAHYECRQAARPTLQCVECGTDTKFTYNLGSLEKEPLCMPCFHKLPDDRRAEALSDIGEPKPQPTTSKQALEEIREKKRLEAIAKGELCYRCGKGVPDPGHDLCYGCEYQTQKRTPRLTGLGEMAETAMYGWLGDFAKTLDSPMSAAYPTVLCIAAGYGVANVGRLRSNLYGNIIGRKNSGKTRVIERALESWHAPSDQQIVRRYPGSEVGLIQLLGGKKHKDMEENDFVPKPYLLAQDEMRITFNKMDIQGSSLPNMLNEMFYRDDFGTASKQGNWVCCARLSVIGGLTADGPDQFAEIYGAATTQGTHDRTIFGIMPDNWDFDDMWEPQADLYRRAGTTELTKESYETVKQWRGENVERRRLGEIALRIAVITASLNHDATVTPECLAAALEFAEWQEKVRQWYAPSETDDLDGKAEQAIIRALGQETGWVEWRELCQKRNLHRAAKSAVRLNRVKKALIYEEVIEEEYEKDESGNGKDSKERTGRVRLKP